MDIKVPLKIIASKSSDVCMNKCASWIVKFIRSLGILVKIHAGDDIDTCLAETAGHTTSATEKVYGFELRIICLGRS